MAFDLDYWQGRLRALATECQVPGASFAVLVDGAIHTGATGVLNHDNGVETDTDSVFQIGSITKVYTATMVLQLVEEGLVELDAPVLRYLPELRLSTPGLVDEVTVRQLLTHTSGIDGDHFYDGGRGDDALQRFVASCASIGLTHPAGATMSYCNSGFSLLGAIIERVTSTTWDAALRSRIIEPLGLKQTVTLAEDALRFRVAYGHGVSSEGTTYLAPTWALPRSVGPAGGITATASEVVTFAAAHLVGPRLGLQSILPEARKVEMLVPQVRIPDQSGESERHIGLAWVIQDWDGRLVYGHDGGTIGQESFLRVVPDADVVLCLLTNGGRTQQLYQRFFAELLEQLCDLVVPALREPPATPAAVTRADYLGVYQRLGERIEIVEVGDELRATLTVSAALSDELPTEVAEATLIPVREGYFLARFDESDPWAGISFYTADGEKYLHHSGRAARKVA
ncbi:MAG: beta-lactamase family protein [Actinomycetota bacterium]|nr:beta-lactamase family protein [Actinomycetota bacterium]